jgi:hypothetical protein
LEFLRRMGSVMTTREISDQLPGNFNQIAECLGYLVEDRFVEKTTAERSHFSRDGYRAK